MKTLGQTGSGPPRARVHDYELALHLAATFGAKDAVKDGLQQLRDATATFDKARDGARVAASNATKRESAAHAAEADATHARQALANETAAARAEFDQRETAVTGREHRATEAEKSQEARDKELARRADHLRKAGVAGF